MVSIEDYPSLFSVPTLHYNKCLILSDAPCRRQTILNISIRILGQLVHSKSPRSKQSQLDCWKNQEDILPLIGEGFFSSE